jgi:single-strand DNA-binding protein
MGRSLNKVMLLGNLGRDAETKFTPSGVARTTFSIATTRRIRDAQTNDWKDETDWHNVVLWRSENLSNFLTKGKQVFVEGRLQTRNYEDKDGRKVYVTEVVAEEVILLGGREGGSSSTSTGDEYSQGVSSAPRGYSSRPGGSSSSSGTGGPGGAQPQPRREESFGEITDDDVPF